MKELVYAHLNNLHNLERFPIRLKMCNQLIYCNLFCHRRIEDGAAAQHANRNIPMQRFVIYTYPCSLHSRMSTGLAISGIYVSDKRRQT